MTAALAVRVSVVESLAVCHTRASACGATRNHPMGLRPSPWGYFVAVVVMLKSRSTPSRRGLSMSGLMTLPMLSCTRLRSSSLERRGEAHGR